jgi:GH18 family chitinase
LLGEHSDRLTVGLPLYSRGWTLDDPAKNNIYDTGTNGTMGPYTRQDGILGYNEVLYIHDKLDSKTQNKL